MLKARNDSILAIRPAVSRLSTLALAGIVYLTCCVIVPPLITGDLSFSAIWAWVIESAPFLAVAFVPIGAFAFFRELDMRRLRETSTDLDALRTMDWQNFELLVAEGFRRLGYKVDNHGWYVPNSPVHITLLKDGEKTLVECRQWRASEVGLTAVHDLFSTMANERADGALLLTSGRFSPEAEAFARDKPIGLIDGEALLELVETVQKDARTEDADSRTPCCPVCERPMVKRKAGRSSTIGVVYWGCSAYPRCLGTRQI